MALNSKAIGAGPCLCLAQCRSGSGDPKKTANIIFSREKKLHRAKIQKRSGQNGSMNIEETFRAILMWPQLMGLVDDVIDPQSHRKKLKETLRCLQN